MPQNSANLFIPKIDYPCETIVCLLNSKLYTFIYRKKYHSKKVLRAHIESLPIPKIDFNYHQKFKDIYDNFIKGRDCNIDLNYAVYKIFNFTEKEIEIIEKGFNNGKINK